MEFGPAPSRRTRETVVPMINIVFLLLVFFLMTATIAPPEPFAVAPPEAAEAEEVAGEAILHVGGGGELALGALRGEAVFGAVAGLDAPLRLRADAGLAAGDLVTLLARLAEAGAAEVSLVAVRP